MRSGFSVAACGLSAEKGMNVIVNFIGKGEKICINGRRNSQLGTK